MRPLLPALLAAAAAFASPPAAAIAQAQAELLNLRFTLVDLDPGDGIAPSFEFVADPEAPNRQRTELTVDVLNSGLGTADNAIQADFSFIAALTLTRAVAGNTALSESGPDRLNVEVTSTARGRASGFASAESNVFFSGDFGLRLSPHTAITISADANLSASDAGAPGALDHAFEFAQAEAFLRVRAADPGDGSGPQEDLALLNVATVDDANADSDLLPGQTLSVSFQNLSAGDLYGYLSARATATAWGASPIPEPATLGLAAAGLAVVAALARRRRSR